MVLYKKAMFPIVILLFSIGYFLEATTLGKPVATGNIRPSFIPLVLGISAICFSLILTIRAIKDIRSAEKLREKSLDKTLEESRNQTSALPVLTILAVSIYIFLFSIVGYFLSSLPFAFAIITIFSNKEKWVLKLVYSVAIVAFGYIVFEQLFGVRLPTFRG